MLGIFAVILMIAIALVARNVSNARKDDENVMIDRLVRASKGG